MMLSRLALPAALVLALGGCSWFGGTKKPDYQGAQARATQPLEVPPELTAPTMDDRYQIPDPHAQTTYSAYSKEVARGGTGTPQSGAASVLPAVEGVRLERYGDQRWLVVKADPDKVWPVVRQFWIDQGIALDRESPDVGIMETAWYEDRTKIPQDFVRRTIGRVVGGLYSTPRRDRFRTRLERGTEPGTTEIYITDRAMEEIYTNVDQDRTAWQPLPADRELEAEKLTQLMERFGAKAPMQTTAAKTPAGQLTAAKPAPGPAEALNAVLENNGAGPLVVNDGFDRAWRRVGLALDRSGFTVEDRDRSKGLFFVRYIDPDAQAAPGEKKGFLSSLAFWRSTPKSAQPQYRIEVSDAGANTSRVQVQDMKGEPEKSSTGRKILSVLYEQLK